MGEAGGGAVMRYLHGSALIARLTWRSHSAIAQVDGIVAIEPYHPAMKLAPTANVDVDPSEWGE